jgi:general secretion pathway protein B
LPRQPRRQQHHRHRHRTGTDASANASASTAACRETRARAAAAASRRHGPESAQAQAPEPKPARPALQATQAPVFAQADLPPAVREQLPTLQLAGVTHSTNPLYRMVIVNGQVLHEGDQAAPGLVLERIEPGRTVGRFVATAMRCHPSRVVV